MESKKELYTAQSRCLKDEVSTIKSEIRERKDRIENLKIRHEHTVKAMGETKKVKKKEIKLVPHPFCFVIGKKYFVHGTK